jgi:hypothetical protein
MIRDSKFGTHHFGDKKVNLMMFVLVMMGQKTYEYD